MKIEATRCSDGFQGTGWIAGRGIVVTNAHVVSAAKTASVTKGGTTADKGFRLAFPAAARRSGARLGAMTSNVGLDDLDLDKKARAGISLTMKERLVTLILEINGPGGSDGSMVDRHGRVPATVFSGIPRQSIAARNA